MRVEAEARVGAPRGKHSPERKTYFSGYRGGELNSRVGTLYLMVSKVRKGGYILFFLTERKRSEAALMSLVEEAFVNGDRAVGEGSGDREYLRLPGVGDNAGPG